MAGFLNTGLTALIGARAALDVTGHNIANANTPGYSRQRVNFAPQPSQPASLGFIGSGVTATGIERFYDQYIAENVIDGKSLNGRLDTLSAYSDRINNLLADSSIGLAPALDGFFASIQDASNDPASLELRRLVIGQAEGLTQRFNLLDTEVNRLESEINQEISGTVDEINSITSEIGALNQEIVLARRGGRSVPNDLLDQRNLRIEELSDRLAIETVEDSDGYINVIARPGTALITGPNSNTLALRTDPLNPDRVTLGLIAGDSATVVELPISGGRLGGLIEARSSVIDGARRELGLTALGISDVLNSQLAEGFDLNDSFGAALFSVNNPGAGVASTNNTGSAALAVSVADVTALLAEDYRVDFDGSNFQVSRAGDGSAVTSSGTGSSGDPLLFEGISVVVSGAAANGDTFAVRPTRDAAGAIRTSLADPRELALAAPVRSGTGSANIGDASISTAHIVDASDPDLLSSTLIEFVDTETYSINGAGTFSYLSGEAISINGVSVEISGQPRAGDQFTIGANLGGSGDNRNAALLTALQTASTLKGGTTSLLENYSSLVTEVGATTRNLQAGLNAQSTLLDAAIRDQQQVSGVDLDEEAANLIRFQQSYQAAAQLVSVANTLFDELIGAVRR